MAENEALEIIKGMSIHPNCEMVKAFDFQSTVIKALEDLQRYRAIGTVAEIKSIIQCNLAEHDRLSAFDRIGTVEEFKELKEKAEPKKPLLVPMDDTCLYCEKHCPNCESLLVVRYKHCPKCSHPINRLPTIPTCNNIAILEVHQRIIVGTFILWNRSLVAKFIKMQYTS